MASPAEITQELPDILPDDFDKWDGITSIDGSHALDGLVETAADDGISTQGGGEEIIQTAVPESSHEATSPVCAVLEEASELDNRSTGAAEAIRPAPVLEPREVRPGIEPSLTSMPLHVAVTSELPKTIRSPKTAARSKVDEISLNPVWSDALDTGKQKSARFKWITVGVASGCAILLLLFLIVWKPGFSKKSIAKAAGETRPALSDNSFTPNIPKPSPSTPLIASPAAAATETTPDANSQPAAEGEGEAEPPSAQMQAMNDQLNSPTRIPRDIKTKVVETAPPSSGFDAASTEGLGTNLPMGNILPGQKQPTIKAAPAGAVTISAGVATGLLIQKTTPVYPAIAKSAHVGGTIELHAKISKAGTVEDLRVVSGPPMLRQSAVEAVRTWRYKPYKLNNEPIEVETTVYVIFSLGN